MTFELSTHAIERYRERVKPAITFRQAANELAWVAAHADASTEQPVWLDGRREGIDTWLVLCDSIVLPIAGGCVITCLTRSGMGPVRRAQVTRMKEPRRRFDRKTGRHERHRLRALFARMATEDFDDNETGAALLATGGAPDHREVPR